VRAERIAYAAYYADGLGPWIEVVDVDGKRPERIRRGDSPSWKRDGIGLLYSDARCDDYDYYYGPVCAGGIGVVDPEVGRLEILPAGVFGFQPAWSPTRDEILFDRKAPATDSYQLNRVVTSIGTMPTAVSVPGSRSTGQGSWSPDGERIAFACDLGPNNVEICAANRDGTAMVKVTSDGRSPLHPAWSPDGQRIAYDFYPGGNARREIAVIDLVRGTVITLGTGLEPAWSPDGSKLVFTGDLGLFVMNPDGTGRQRLTSGDHRAPAWRPKL
jgi:Tol biopolymer transport system component